ncbi:MAG TPA: hypothetical protein VGL71_07080 [Urbifossiella sp.]
MEYAASRFHIAVSRLPGGGGMKLPRGIGPGAIAFLALWLILLAGGRSNFLRDPGTFWHVATGERILGGGFLRTDPYTFTFPNTWWVPYQWLGEVAMALMHRAAGFDGLLLGSVTILAAIFAWLTVRLLDTGLHPIAVAVIIFFGVAASSSHFHVRPHLFTIAGMAITMALLVDVEAGRIPLKRMLWLVPLYVIWVNVHGGVLGGMATLVLAAAGWIFAWRIGWPSPVQSVRDAAWILGIAAACCATAFVNPYGTDLIKTWYVIMGEPVLRQIIQEHSPLTWSDPTAWPILGFAGLYLIILAGAPVHRMRVTWLLPVVWFLLTLDRVRHAPLFAVLTLIGMASLWPQTRWAEWLKRNRPDFYQPNERERTPLWANVWLPAVVVLLSFVLQCAHVNVPLIGASWARHDARHWPVELIDVLKDNEPRDGRNNHIFNDYIDGGFVIYHAPGYKVFVDDRCEVFGGDWLLKLVNASGENTAGAIVEWERTYGSFNYALTRTDSGFDGYFANSPAWECLKRTESAAFYKRK